MEDYKISEVSRILSEWNPLGNEAKAIKDLDGYKTESIDILFQLEMTSGRANINKVVMQVLNEAFDLELTEKECSGAASSIVNLLSKKH